MQVRLRPRSYPRH